MSTCTVTYSAEVVRRAVRTYFWRRFATPWGLFYLLSFPLVIGAIYLAYYFQGPNWFVGAFGTIVCMNMTIQTLYYLVFPRAYAKRFADPANIEAEIEVSDEGIRIAINRSTSFRKWKAFKYIWPYQDFIILASRPTSMQPTVIPTEGMTDEVYRELVQADRNPATT